MKKIILTSVVLASLFTFSCKNKTTQREVVREQETAVYTQTPSGESESSDIIKGSITNPQGKTLNYTFDNSTNRAVFVLDGETIHMELDTTKASGSNYRNNNYTFTQWHGTTELKKDGKTIFEYKDTDGLNRTFTGTDGKKMEVSFDNANNKVKIRFNGEDIELKEDRTASGFKYSNSTYEYVEHQGQGELRKNGRVVFRYNN